MGKWNKIALKHFVLFCIGFVVYMGIEILYRGYTFYSMGVAGGLCFLIIGALNEFYTWNMNFWKQCCIGAIVVTILEFTVKYLFISTPISSAFISGNDDIDILDTLPVSSNTNRLSLLFTSLLK